MAAIFLLMPLAMAGESKAFGSYSVTTKQSIYGAGWSDTDSGKGTLKIGKSSMAYSFVFKSGDRAKGTVYFEHALSPTATKQSFSGLGRDGSDSFAVTGTIRKTSGGWSVSAKYIVKGKSWYASGKMSGSKK